MRKIRDPDYWRERSIENRRPQDQSLDTLATEARCQTNYLFHIARALDRMERGVVLEPDQWDTVLHALGEEWDQLQGTEEYPATDEMEEVAGDLETIMDEIHRQVE